MEFVFGSGGPFVYTEVFDHPLLGRAQWITNNRGERLTAMSALDWNRPTEIPIIAEPRKLPPNAGTGLLNDIAGRAKSAGVATLRYAGPYPTPALYRSLLRSFRTTGTEEEFTRDVLGRALRVDRTEIPIDFRPAPWGFRAPKPEWGEIHSRDHVVERVYIDRVVFGNDTGVDTLARLVKNGDRYEADLAIDGHRIALIATFDQNCELLEGLHPVPRFAVPPAPGNVFPVDLAEQLAELATEYVPEPLADDVQRLIATRPISWADLRERAARRTDDGFELHVAFLALAKRDMARFAELLSYHLARTAQSAVLDEVVASRQ